MFKQKIISFVCILMSIYFSSLDYAYRQPIFFTIALILFIVFLIFKIVVSFFKKEKTYKRNKNIFLFLLGVVIISPVIGYLSNYILPYRIEKYAKTIPESIKHSTFQNGILSSVEKNFLLKNLNENKSIYKKHYILITSEEGFLLSVKKYSIFQMNMTQDILYLKSGVWEKNVRTEG